VDYFDHDTKFAQLSIRSWIDEAPDFPVPPSVGPDDCGHLRCSSNNAI